MTSPSFTFDTITKLGGAATPPGTYSTAGNYVFLPFSAYICTAPPAFTYSATYSPSQSAITFDSSLNKFDWSAMPIVTTTTVYTITVTGVLPAPDNR